MVQEGKMNSLHSVCFSVRLWLLHDKTFYNPGQKTEDATT
jgi:hypothetical protein